ncbi:helix-turn-helix domain-containing protein [Streptomyces sp. KL2]|uniref:helix-turn-helix domain-containing protein n=1 Tax=Streptomyces sp. KL2 TaxID=3050126 RepID=UPI00397AE31C
MNREELGLMAGCSPATIASIEQGRRIPSDRFIDKTDEVLDASGILKEMKEEIHKARCPRSFQGAATLEREAVELYFYDAHVVNGLLQTEDYARCVFGMHRPALDEETVERRLAARTARQEIFTKGSTPLMSYVIEEVALRRPVGGRRAMRGRSERILQVGRRRGVVVQVMPTNCEEHVGLAGPFTLIETGEGRRIAYAEVRKSGTSTRSGSPSGTRSAAWGHPCSGAYSE